MKSAPDTPNVVEACNLEGRQERLDGLLSQLEMCEKALQVSQAQDGTRCSWQLCQLQAISSRACKKGWLQVLQCLINASFVLAIRSVCKGLCMLLIISDDAGLLGNQAGGLPTVLLCGSCRSAGHPVQGFKPSAHPQVLPYSRHDCAGSVTQHQLQSVLSVTATTHAQAC